MDQHIDFIKYVDTILETGEIIEAMVNNVKFDEILMHILRRYNREIDFIVAKNILVARMETYGHHHLARFLVTMYEKTLVFEGEKEDGTRINEVENEFKIHDKQLLFWAAYVYGYNNVRYLGVDSEGLHYGVFERL